MDITYAEEISKKFQKSKGCARKWEDLVWKGGGEMYGYEPNINTKIE